jgi:hypothetical protein
MPRSRLPTHRIACTLICCSFRLCSLLPRHHPALISHRHPAGTKCQRSTTDREQRLRLKECLPP